MKNKQTKIFICEYILSYPTKKTSLNIELEGNSRSLCQVPMHLVFLNSGGQCSLQLTFSHPRQIPLMLTVEWPIIYPSKVTGSISINENRVILITAITGRVAQYQGDIDINPMAQGI